ncbi:MAG: HPr(Ser) kinase/phosphatase [Candidatus Electryoneaceae bacterium]|nr:HPr(Ser) kinase/phosphatase [Candidatus Electryoneaceae bacterium]
MSIQNKNESVLCVRKLIGDNARDLRLRVLTGSIGLQHPIREKNLHRPGLALTGFFEGFPSERVQLFGTTEIVYLRNLPPEDLRNALERLFRYPIPCVIVTDVNSIPPVMIELAHVHEIPLITTSLTTTATGFLLSNYLYDCLSPSEEIHGTLVDVYGTGLLFVGRPGIGKSEVALDLIERGHRLIADDRIVLTRKPPGILIGTGPEILKHFIEIRGVGVIDVQWMFGVRAIRVQKRVEVVVELLDWDDQENYERLGLNEQYREYLGMKIPLIRLPVYPGKNITVITESIALNLHLKVYGDNAAQELSRRQRARMKVKKKLSDYLKGDGE